MDKLKKHDWVITIIVVLLLSIGMLIIFSNTYNTDVAIEGSGTIPKQLAFIILGMIVYFSVSNIDLRWLRLPAVLTTLYMSTIGLLVYLLLFGKVVEETQRWIKIGFISIQPSEIAKITVIIITAYIFGILTFQTNSSINWGSDKRDQHNIKHGLINICSGNQIIFKYMISLFLLGPILGLVFMQPALGNTLILFMIWLITVVVAFPEQLKLFTILTLVVLYSSYLYNLVTFPEFLGIVLFGKSILFTILLISCTLFSIFFLKIEYRYILLVIFASVVLLPIFNFGWNNVLAPYHRERIMVYLQGPEADKYGSGYQVIQSQIALGSGQLNGRGYLRGTQSALKVLDFAHTDFIFASTGEQFGFIGGATVLLLYLVLIIRILNIGVSSEDTFNALLVTGIAVMVSLNVFINVGMNMGILPVTGVPLPLVSYGGSSIIVNLIGLGLVQAAKTNFRSIDMSDEILVLL